jgi:hypothetical protein
MTVRAPLTVVVLAFGLVGTAPAQSRLAKPTIDTVNHRIVRVVNNGPAAWADTNGWKLVYERTVQPAEGSPGVLENPGGILLLNDGRLLEWDFRTPVINLYDAQGSFVRKLGRAGAGPGEFRATEPAIFHDTLVVNDPRLGRMTLMSLTGSVIRTVPTLCCDEFALNVDDRGRARIHTTKVVNGVFRATWVGFDLTGRRVDSIPSPQAISPRTWTVKEGTGESVFNVPFAGQNVVQFLRDGSMIYGATDQAQWFRSSNGIDTLQIFTIRGTVPMRIPEAQRDSMFRRLVDHNERLRAIAAPSDIPNIYPLWRRMDVDGRDDLWIMLGGDYGTPILGFYVLDRASTLLGTVPSPFRSATFISWAGDRIAVEDTDENDLPRIRIFRVDRRGH